MRELKGEAEPAPQAQLNLGLNIRIPANYILEENQRLRMYKRIAGVETERQLSDVEAEVRDRYGDPPVAVQQLLRYAALRLQAVDAGVTGIERKRDLVSVKFRQDAPVDPVRLAKFCKRRDTYEKRTSCQLLYSHPQDGCRPCWPDRRDDLCRPE